MTVARQSALSPELLYKNDLCLLEEMRSRLYRRRAAALKDFNVFSVPESISVCEGGCLFPTHPSLTLAANEVLLMPTSYPSHIYPQANVLPEFLAAIRRFFHQECRIQKPYSQTVAFGIGISQLFDVFIPTIALPGDIILAPESYYHAFVAWPEKWGVRHLRVPTQLKNGFKLTAADLANWFEANPDQATRVKAVLITNPTTAGAIYSQSEIDELAGALAKYRIYAFVDEVFRDTEFGKHRVVSLASNPIAAPWCVTAHSGSKARGAANFRIGWCCGPEALIKAMEKLCDKSVTEYPFLIQKIGQAVLDLPREYIDSSIDELGKRAWRLLDLIADQNALLREHFNIDYDIIETPVIPHGGHSLLLRLEHLRGAIMPSGKKIETALDMTQYFFESKEVDGTSNSICLSTGSTKGHVDLICYFAFSQTGHEYLAAIAERVTQPYVANHLFGDKTVAYNPYYEDALAYGRELNDEAMRRLTRAIKALQLSL